MPQSVKHLPAMRETQVLFLGQEDPLEEKMALHSSIFDLRGNAFNLSPLRIMFAVGLPYVALVC